MERRILASRKSGGKVAQGLRKSRSPGFQGRSSLRRPESFEGWGGQCAWTPAALK